MNLRKGWLRGAGQPAPFVIFKQRIEWRLTMQIQRDGYIISTDRMRLDLDVIHDFLANQSY